MDLTLKGKVVIVTGAGEGVGRRCILAFAEEGTNVVINDIMAEKAEGVASEARAFGVQALPILADVTNATQVNEMAKKTLDKFGRIDILVNNAFMSDWQPFTRSTREDWDKPINTCLYGTLNCTRAVINTMVEQKYGKVISVLSDAARIGEPWLPVYSAAKAAILVFTKALAKEVGPHNLNINCVSLSATNTERRRRKQENLWAEANTEEERERFRRKEEKQLELYPLRRLGEPEDAANMIVFLASERARHITGQTFSVNGGFCMVD